MGADLPLWDDEPLDGPGALGPIRRALEHDLEAARAAGRTFLETQVAAIRRQANDLDRLERILDAAIQRGKAWDYNPKTTATQAYLLAIRDLFGEDETADDPFLAAVRELDAARSEEAARSRATEALDPARPDPAD